MCPSPEASSAGSSAFVTRRVPITLVSNIQRQSSSSACATGSRPFAPPALFTSSDTSGTAAANAATDSASVTSRRTAVPSISGGDLGAAVRPAGAEHDVEAGLGQGAGGGRADAGAGAGDDGGGAGSSLMAGQPMDLTRRPAVRCGSRAGPQPAAS